MDDLRINERFVVPSSEIRVSVSRSSGPGGQHVNTTDTRVRLHFHLGSTRAFPPHVRERVVRKLAKRLTSDGNLVITSDRYRSQHRNLDDALQRLAEMLVDGLVIPKRRKKTRPSKGAVRRRAEGKKQRSALKQSRRKPRHDD